MIPEPQRTYVLELIAALGPAANDFVLAGAQAMKFTVTGARGTKDVDFLLNVIALRDEPLQLATILGNLGYQPIEGARNFQFEKPIPNSSEKMPIEFMASEEYKRRGPGQKNPNRSESHWGGVEPPLQGGESRSRRPDTEWDNRN